MNGNIRVEDVVVEYSAGSAGARRILNSINLEIEAGEFVSIVGETGCGKSTLLRLMLGGERPTRGHVLVNDRERLNPDRVCGYVPQKYALFPDKTVLGNVTFGLDVSEFGLLSILSPRRRARLREFRAEALRYLDLVGLSASDAGKYPHQLSGGMQQRVAIAQALIMKPPILLMDEAFSALDPATRRGMQRLMKELWRASGTTIVFVTHNMHEAVCLGSRVIALAKTSAEAGASIALDLSVPHVEFDSDRDEIRLLTEKIERATLPGLPVEATAAEMLLVCENAT
jgi:NitT/TauT family transport system ATP-binding protein